MYLRWLFRDGLKGNHMINKYNLTEKIKKAALPVVMAGAIAAPNAANANLVTDITNFYNPNDNSGKIVFNIFDDAGLALAGATLLDFYGGDLQKSNITAYTGDLNNVPFGTFFSTGDINGDGKLSGELSYNNVLNNNSLNISGRSVVSYTNVSFIDSTYNVNNVAQTPIPSTALLFGTGLVGLGVSRRKETVKKD